MKGRPPNHWALNQPWPKIDYLTLALVLAVSLVFSIQGIFGFTLSDYLPDWTVMPIYVSAGVSAIWQFLRQR